MHIEFLVEELSAEAVLRVLIPKLIGANHTFDVLVFRGKNDLLANLESRLRAYRRWLAPDTHIVILIDQDSDDCRHLKRRLERIVEGAGFATGASNRGPTRTQVLTRIAVEELEAWFFGDVDALRSAYPRIARNLRDKAGYRDPDSIRGGTAEALERVLQRAGYHKGGLEKIKAARNISSFMEPARNRSRSFQVFRRGVLRLAGRVPD
jgi:hypothetical protein